MIIIEKVGKYIIIIKYPVLFQGFVKILSLTISHKKELLIKTIPTVNLTKPIQIIVYTITNTTSELTTIRKRTTFCD